MPDPVMIEFNGEALSIRQWAARLGINQITLCYRLGAGWSIERAFAPAVVRTLEHNGETLTVAQWAARAGMSSQTLRARLARNWPLERALSQPVRAKKGKAMTSEQLAREAGVPSDFARLEGTGGGGVARDISELEFSE